MLNTLKIGAFVGMAAVLAPSVGAAQTAAPAAPAQRAAPAVDNSRAPVVAFDTQEFGKLPGGRNFGEVLGVAVNSKGNVVILNHPGSAAVGPIYNNASTELFEFDAAGNFIREIGEKVYALAYAHAIRFDKDDNLWVVDKGANSVIKFDPNGKVLMNLGRREEGFNSAPGEHLNPTEAVPTDSNFRGPTDVAWDQDGNIFVSDGYINSRIAKISKDGDWIKSWGRNGRGGANADENPASFSLPHSMVADRNGNVYVADRNNRRIQVFDRNGNFLRFLFLNAPYDKSCVAVLGNTPPPETRPDRTQPWAMCITNTATQYLYVVDAEPGRLYKMTIDGKIVAMLGSSGRRMGQFNWPHSLACPTENTVFLADMNNWRVQKLTIYPEQVVRPTR